MISRIRISVGMFMYVVCTCLCECLHLTYKYPCILPCVCEYVLVRGWHRHVLQCSPSHFLGLIIFNFETVCMGFCMENSCSKSGRCQGLASQPLWQKHHPQVHWEPWPKNKVDNYYRRCPVLTSSCHMFTYGHSYQLTHAHMHTHTLVHTEI